MGMTESTGNRRESNSGAFKATLALVFVVVVIIVVLFAIK